jgi:purine-binding chemotaxis protein CheW
MSRADNKDTKLMEQQGAVMSYLEDLLQEVPEALAEEIPDNVITVFPKQEQPQQQQQNEQTLKSVQPAPQHTETQSAATDDLQAGTRSLPNVPVWAAQEFQCLMFNVVGISLAVPLVKLNGVIPWDNNLTPMPGHSDAFLGLLRHLDKNVKIMDTAQVILPPAQLQQVPAVDARIQKIILMDEGRWGLACDEIGEVITLQADDVRWRSEAGRRPWLAGTISERLCALLDTDELARILSAGK